MTELGLPKLNDAKIDIDKSNSTESNDVLKVGEKASKTSKSVVCSVDFLEFIRRLHDWHVG